MNARTAEEQRALEVPSLPMPLEDYLRELGDLKVWRQEIFDRRSEAKESDALDGKRLDRVIEQLSGVLASRDSNARGASSEAW
jgi:hypothetical protein